MTQYICVLHSSATACWYGSHLYEIELNPFSRQYGSRAMRKHVFKHMRTAKALSRLRIRAVCSGPSLTANGIIRIIQNVWMESKCPDETLRMRWINLNRRILRMLEDTFCLARPIIFAWYMFSATIFILSIGTDRSEQTVLTQIEHLIRVYPVSKSFSSFWHIYR